MVINGYAAESPEAGALRWARELLGPLCPAPGPGGPLWMESVLPEGWEGPADRFVRFQRHAVEARQKRDPCADVGDINLFPDRALSVAQRDAVAREFLRYATARARAEGVHVWGVSAEHHSRSVSAKHPGLVIGILPHPERRAPRGEAAL